MNKEILKITKELGEWVNIPKDKELLVYHIVMQAYHEGRCDGMKTALDIHNEVFNKPKYLTEEQAIEKARQDESAPTKEAEIL